MRPHQNVIIPKTQNTESSLRQTFIAPFIVVAFRVPTAICLDNQMLLERNKIYDPCSDRYLAMKLHACKPTRAEQAPELDFDIRCVCSERSCKGSLPLSYTLTHPLTRPPSAATLSHKGRGKKIFFPFSHHHHD